MRYSQRPQTPPSLAHNIYLVILSQARDTGAWVRICVSGTAILSNTRCPCKPLSTVRALVVLAIKCPFVLTADFLEKILVITADGRTLVGTLLSCDQLTNIVLNETIERIIRPQDDPEPSSEVSHGLYLVRGDNITICGLVDEDLDNSINWAEVRGQVIGGTKHV